MDMEGRPVKPIEFLGSSLDDLRDLPEEVSGDAGHQLFRVQQGRMPEDWKPMPTVGVGVIEIRVRTRREHRAFYVAKFEEAVYVLHVFEKKSQKTAAKDLAVGAARYRELVHRRRGR
jgi:phage-related protein